MPPPNAPIAGSGLSEEPLRAYNFNLSFGPGEIVGHFTAVSGLQVEIDRIRYREAGNNQVVYHLPGQVRYQPIELRYGVTTSDAMWRWMKNGITGQVDKRTVSIVMLDRSTGSEIEKFRWNLSGVWVCRWSGAPLDTLTSEVAVESMALAFDAIDRG